MALLFRGRVVSSSRGVLLHLPENPRISRRSSTDHHRVATRLPPHPLRVFRRIYIAITNYGNLHRLLNGRDDRPVSGAGITLRARARVHGYTFDSHVFGHLSNLDRDDRVLIPSGAEL